MKQVNLPSGPYLRTAQTTRNMMFHVALSLVPALLGAVYFFRIRALYLTALSVAVCVITEYLWQKLTGKQITAGDFSAVVTGMLLAFNMPIETPVWVIVATAVFSILFVKQMFGGIGNNFANPALMGRLFAMVVCAGHCHAVHRPPHASGGRRIFGNCTWNSQERWGSRLQLSPDVSR